MGSPDSRVRLDESVKVRRAYTLCGLHERFLRQGVEVHRIWCGFCTGCNEKGAILGITFEGFQISGAHDYTESSGMGALQLK